MNSWPPRNLDYLQRQDLRLYETISDLVNGVSTMAQQGNLNPNNNPVAPKAPGSMKVVGKNGHFSVSIQDGSQMYRGINYSFEHSTDPHFGNVQRVHMGPSRTHNLYLGNVTRYFRSQSFYDSSAPSPYVYHGNAAAPQPVSGGGTQDGPAFLDDEGSGTGTSGQPGGSGPVPFRSTSGAPPVRGASAQGGGTGAGSGGNPVITPSAVGLVAAIPPSQPAAPNQPITVPPSCLVVASNATRQLVKAVLASAKFWLGDGSGAVAAVSMSGDATMDNAGAVTLKTVNSDVGSFGDSTHTVTVTTNAKGLITAITVNSITYPNPTNAQVLAALGFTPATSGANATFSLTASLITGTVTGTITQV